MKENDYIIFADTDSDVTPEIANKYGFKLISMPYTINEKDYFPYKDFQVFNSREFYENLRMGKMPTTSALNKEAYIEYFEPCLKQGKDILYVHFSRAMTASFNAMDIAVKELKEKYPNNTVYDIDTKGITLCAYAIVREVGDMYLQGKSIQEILDWSKVEVDKFPAYFFVNDLTFFKRSGRVKSMAAFMGNLFGIRPIINMDSDGLMSPIGKARGLNGAINKIIEIMENLQDNIKEHRVIIAHSDAIETAYLLVQSIKEKFGQDLKLEIINVNPTAGSHCGPDGVGVCFHGIHR